MDGGGKVGQVADLAEEAGVLDDDAGGLVVDQRQQIFLALRIGRSRDHLEAVEAGVGQGHVAVMRMQAAGQHGLAAPGHPVCHHHGFGAGRGPVVKRGVRHVHAGDQRHLGLELEQVLQRALGDFRLIRRVRGQELAALDQVIDRGRDMMAIGPGPQEARHAAGGNVLRGHRRDRPLDFHLAGMGRQPLDRGRQPGRLRHVAEQAVDRGHAYGGEHRPAVGLGQGQVTHQCRPSQYSLYAASSSRSSRSPWFSIRSLTNQPSPCGSRLTSAGSSARASFTSTTSPATGA